MFKKNRRKILRPFLRPGEDFVNVTQKHDS